MNPLYGAAQDLAAAASNLLAELEGTDDPPTAQQIAAVQDEINKVQQRLNRIQTETDTWSDLRDVG